MDGWINGEEHIMEYAYLLIDFIVFHLISCLSVARCPMRDDCAGPRGEGALLKLLFPRAANYSGLLCGEALRHRKLPALQYGSTSTSLQHSGYVLPTSSPWPSSQSLFVVLSSLIIERKMASASRSRLSSPSHPLSLCLGPSVYGQGAGISGPIRRPSA